MATLDTGKLMNILYETFYSGDVEAHVEGE